jgi:hypothetical protein
VSSSVLILWTLFEERTCVQFCVNFIDFVRRENICPALLILWTLFEENICPALC